MKAPSHLFNKEQAASYDSRFAKLAPMRDALHLLIQVLLTDLPENARILCVGAGTGAELIALAHAFPTFSFTAVEPSEAMLEVCRKRAEEEGISARCTFHLGYIDSLATNENFDAATALLVSQFLVNRDDRIAFFREIAQRLKPDGILISSDLSADLNSPASGELKNLWAKMLQFSGVPADKAAAFQEAWNRNVAVLPQGQVEEIINAAGFDRPTLFYQSVFIHGWFAEKCGSN